MTAAVVLAAVLIIAAIAAAVALARLRDKARYSPRHVFADPADRTDPDGARYIGQLTAAPELRTPPAWHARPSTDLLRQVLDGLRGLPPRTAALTDTRPQPALIAWGGKTPGQLADELAAEHFGTKR